MDIKRILFCIVLSCVSAVGPAPAVLEASEPEARDGSDQEVRRELAEMRKALQEVRRTVESQSELIKKQQARIEELERRLIQPAAPAPSSMEPGISAPAPSAGKGLGLPGQIGSALPEIGLVGDIVATSSEDSGDADGNDRISAREIELVVGGYVDPYSRFDATFAFSDFEAADVEEAYLTRWGLPWDLTARFGRFFPKVGKQAAIHRDQLSTVDEPLVIRRYLGSEGYFRAGVDLSRVLEGPGGWVLEPSVGVLEGGVGDGGSAFGSSRSEPTLYSHLKTYKELTDSSGLELGLTHLLGSKDGDGRFEVNLFGLDATYLHSMPAKKQLKLQGELFAQTREEAFSIAGTGETTQFDRHPWGAYLLADYRFAPQWSAGVRADHVRLVETSGPRQYDQGLSAFLTFHQSEWARWRLQLRHEERGPEKTDDSVMLQGTFAVGTHKHKIQ